MTSRQTRSSYAKAKATGPGSGSGSTSNPIDRAEVRVSKSKSKSPSVSKSLTTAVSNPEASKKVGKPIYFWREYGSPNCYLSQWYASPFHAEHSPGGKEIIYQTAEQYMMHHKALLFHDYTVAAKILTISSPKAVKGLGRKVKPFNQATWEAHRSKIVEDASYYKFKFGLDEGDLSFEGKTLKDRLLETGDKEIVEASPMDRIWGIGLGEAAAEENREEWGLNLLGKALMVARKRLREEAEEEEKEKAKGEKSKA